MSDGNVALVKRVLAAHDRGDLAAVFAAYDPEIEWSVAALQPAGAANDFDPVYRGHEGVRTFWRRWFDAWETVAFEYDEFIDAGDKVVSILSQRMRGRTSGIEIAWDGYAQIWTVRAGKIARVEFFPSRRDALAALGLDREGSG